MDLEARSVKNKWKYLADGAGVPTGMEFGIDLWGYVGNLIEVMHRIAPQ